MKKQIFQICALSMALSANSTLALANPVIQKRSISASLIDEARDALHNAKVSQSQSFPTLDLLSGKAFISGKVTAKSNPSIGQKYSKYMVWEIGATVLPELLGLNNLPFSLSLSGTREITFIRQFESQQDSLIKYWYDPVTKVPLDSSYFDLKEKPKVLNKKGQPEEIAGAQEEYTIRPGDFIGFRAPITFSAGKGLLNHLTREKIHPVFDAGISYYVSGEFDIQIFRIDEDHIQVKILAIQDNTFSASTGVKLIGFDRYGKLVFNRLFNTNIFSLYYADRDSDLFLADYVFNLKSKEARQQYDELVAGKMKLLSAKALAQNFEHADPAKSLDEKKDELLIELDRINKLAESENKNSLKRIDQKAVLKIVAGHNLSNLVSKGIKFNAFKIVGVENSSLKTTSRIAMMDGYSLNDLSVYFLNSYVNTFSYDWLWLYGEQDRMTLDFLVKAQINADKTETPNEFLGLRVNRTKKDLALTQDEYVRLEERFNSILPAPIREKLKFPKWDFNGLSSIKNVFVNQEVYFTNEIFNLDPSELSENMIRENLLNILMHMYKLTSLPYGMTGHETDLYTGGLDEKLKACFSQNGTDEKSFAKKKIAYNYEIENIPKMLSSIFSQRLPTDASQIEKIALNKKKYDKFQFLLSEVPLFREIAGLLLLKLTPDKDIDKYVVARLSMSGRKVNSEISVFPDEASFEKTKLFRGLLDQNGYLTDRSYNLRNFFNEDGQIKTLEQIVIR